MTPTPPARPRRRLAAVLGGAFLAVVCATTGASAVTAPASAAAPAAPASAPAPAASADAPTVDVPAVASATQGLRYVALGDSYSAGFGIRPFSFTSPADGCYQADQNYPKLVAAQLGLDLTDATCSGAVTANITTTPQLTITKEGTAPIQGENLSAETQLVTVSIGGNDLGFADVAQFCVALSPTGPVLGDPLFANCKGYYDPAGVDTLEYRLKTVVEPRLTATFAYITAHAPNAKVIVVGYPAIAPDAANTPADGCFTPAIGSGVPPFPQNSFPFTDVDTPYLHELEASLDKTIHEQADAAGATYLPLLKETEAHSACANATGEAYVNGVTIDEYVPDDPTTAVNDAILKPALGVLHPNKAGVAFMQAQVAQAVVELFPSDSGSGGGSGGSGGGSSGGGSGGSGGDGSGGGGSGVGGSGGGIPVVTTPGGETAPSTTPTDAPLPSATLAATGLAPLAWAGAAALLLAIGACATLLGVRARRPRPRQG